MEEDDTKVGIVVPEDVGTTLEVSSVNGSLVKLTPTGKISHAKTRVYTQRYRKDWEQMNEFKEWLTSVPNEPTRALCTFCSRNLHAHRLSLLKHMCTLKHQRAAVQFSKRKLLNSQSKTMRQENSYDDSNYISEEEEILDETQQEEMEASDNEIDEMSIKGSNVEQNKQETLIQTIAHGVSDDNDIQVQMVVESENDDDSSQLYEIQHLKQTNDNSDFDERSQEAVNKIENTEPIILTKCSDLSFEPKKVILVSSVDGKSYTMLKGSYISKTETPVVSKSIVSKCITEDDSSTVTHAATVKTHITQSSNKNVTLKHVKCHTQKSPMVSTHVLDTSKGMSVSGLQVLLYKLNDGKWGFVHEATTSADGMCNDFVKPLAPGRYKFHYDVEKYYNARKIATSFPFIEIVFDIKDPQKTYHIPLLISPYGYSTHRDILR